MGPAIFNMHTVAKIPVEWGEKKMEMYWTISVDPYLFRML